LCSVFSDRENELLQTQETQHQQYMDREKHYNELVKAHKDRIIQLEEALKAGDKALPPAPTITPVAAISTQQAFRKPALLDSDNLSEVSESDTSTSPGLILMNSIKLCKTKSRL
jgi:hypothetical protein